MKNWQDIITHPTFRFMDHSNEQQIADKANTAISSFAIDDAITTAVSDGNSLPTVRLWVHPNTIVLGIPDGRLPYLEQGVQMLAQQNYHVIIRNSGGLAVALDKGVLNISLILPDVKHISIHDCYEAMVRFVQFMLADVTDAIEAYEIVGSYCPGDYDLSIGGRKFAGISQRRVKQGAAIQIYLDVEGNAQQRAIRVKEFYDIAWNQAETKFEYPTVIPAKMASLSELLGMTLTVEDMKLRAATALKQLSNDVIFTKDLSSDELAVFEKRYEQMRKRNEKIAKLQQ
ncbi:lipoate--protein ligase family protein [Ornithinibacillus gellani]|uniref:lipoate--protein ligase family protein n=1 Tax=Ornithinibacillus gellani TaxID=2293253 RepID=UPI000F4722FE|nr:biotin/lipoate A/B protein ligase family protein [Ornithinibacillus gellani]TQS72122.1 lipoate--protein ligase family protein [Ornithinibacillus gellani]